MPAAVAPEAILAPRALSAADAATAIREHWAIENRLHWVLDVTFADDQSAQGPPRPGRRGQALNQDTTQDRK